MCDGSGDVVAQAGCALCALATVLERSSLRRLGLAGVGMAPAQARQLLRGRQDRQSRRLLGGGGGGGDVAVLAGCNPLLPPDLVDELARGAPPAATTAAEDEDEDDDDEP